MYLDGYVRGAGAVLQQLNDQWTPEEVETASDLLQGIGATAWLVWIDEHHASALDFLTSEPARARKLLAQSDPQHQLLLRLAAYWIGAEALHLMYQISQNLQEGGSHKQMLGSAAELLRSLDSGGEFPMPYCFQAHGFYFASSDA